MPPTDLPRLLFHKADQDIYVLEKLVLDDDAPLEVFGIPCPTGNREVGQGDTFLQQSRICQNPTGSANW